MRLSMHPSVSPCTHLSLHTPIRPVAVIPSACLRLPAICLPACRRIQQLRVRTPTRERSPETSFRDFWITPSACLSFCTATVPMRLARQPPEAAASSPRTHMRASARARARRKARMHACGRTRGRPQDRKGKGRESPRKRHRRAPCLPIPHSRRGSARAAARTAPAQRARAAHPRRAHTHPASVEEGKRRTGPAQENGQQGQRRLVQRSVRLGRTQPGGRGRARCRGRRVACLQRMPPASAAPARRALPRAPRASSWALIAPRVREHDPRACALAHVLLARSRSAADVAPHGLRLAVRGR